MSFLLWFLLGLLLLASTLSLLSLLLCLPLDFLDYLLLFFSQLTLGELQSIHLGMHLLAVLVLNSQVVVVPIGYLVILHLAHKGVGGLCCQPPNKLTVLLELVVDVDQDREIIFLDLKQRQELGVAHSISPHHILIDPLGDALCEVRSPLG